MRWTDSSVRGRLTWSTGDDAQELLERAAAGDAGAIQEIEEFCAQIAPRLATVLLTVDPERVVVGGGLSRAGERSEERRVGKEGRAGCTPGHVEPSLAEKAAEA